MAVITVSQLNRYVGFKLKDDAILSGMLIRGEITNFTNHYRSGHFYFSLKDEECSIKAVMFRSNAQRLPFVPENGMKVIVVATASLYEKEGVFQLYVTDMQPDGVGSQAIALEQLKKKLTALGIFDSSRKKSLPVRPKRIGVITSDSGAALQDIINVTGRRYPLAQLLVYPAQVQGIEAPASLCRALHCAEREQVDVIIIGRGGGASEDLSAFNAENVVMAIADCEIPIVSAVGHETDWTLADAAADLRAPTPSAAAEMTVPDVQELEQTVQQLENRLVNCMKLYLQRKENAYESLVAKLQNGSPEHLQMLAEKEYQSVVARFLQCGKNLTQRQEKELLLQIQKLEMLSPLKILSRGYSLTYKNDGTLLRSATEVQSGDVLQIKLQQGTVRATVTEGGNENGI